MAPDPAPSSGSPSGLENPAVLDLVIHDPVAGQVTLVMQENRPWKGDRRQLFQIQEKMNSYLSFILDGEMAEIYPAFLGLKLAVRLDCPEYPPDSVIDFLEPMQQQLEKQAIGFELRVVEKVNSGPVS